jgi:UDP-glucose 4-epimerase
LLDVELSARDAAESAGAALTLVRCAPIVGPHMSSPLGRLLRLPIVPTGGLSDLPFSLLHQDDAASAFVHALDSRYDGPLNVVGPGAVTGAQAARLGGRLPLPIVGPQWFTARAVAELFGAPLPPHVRELLTRGRTADGALALRILGLRDLLSTPEVIRDLYDWATVTFLRQSEAA